MKQNFRIKGIIIALAATGMLTACATGGLALPDAPKSERYAATPIGEQTMAADAISQRFIRSETGVARWWQQFGNDTLNALVLEGLSNSPDLIGANQKLNAAREQMRAEIGERTSPKVDLVAQGERQRALGLPNLGPAYSTELYNSFVGQLQASYTIDIFGAVRHANAALADRFEAQGYQFEATQQALALNIVNAVITVATLHDSVETTNRMVALSAQQASDAERRFALGAIGEEELLTERGNAASVAASLPPLQQQLASARHALAVLLGRAPSNAPADLTLADLHLPTDVALVVPSDLLRVRPDIRAADAMLRAAAEDYGTATAQMYPQLNLSASLGRGGFEWGPSMSTLWGVGASIAAPVFHGGALSAQQRAAEASYNATVAEYKKTVLGAFQETANALVALDTDANRLHALSQAESSAKGSFDASSKRAQLGALPLYAARERELQWHQAKLNADQTRGTRFCDTAKLFYVMGPRVDGGGK